MKRLTALLSSLILLCSAFAFALPAPTAFADAMDDEAIATATDAVDELTFFVDESNDTSDEEFYKEFTQKLEETQQSINSAYADLGQTTETGSTYEKVQDVRNKLKVMKRQLGTWKESAEAKDSKRFDAVYLQFTETADEYYVAADEYYAAADSSVSAEESFGYILMAGAGGLVLSPFVILWRRKKSPLHKKNATVADNKLLIVSPTRFLVLNLLTGGVYAVYWAWSSWEIINKLEEKKYWTTIRAYFMAFTSFSLFKKLFTLAQSTGYKKDLDHQGLAVGVLLLAIAEGVIWSMFDNKLILIAAYVVVPALLTWLVMPILKLQKQYVTNTKQKFIPVGSDWFIMTVVTVATCASIAQMITVILS
jgi:hypothetical protein